MVGEVNSTQGDNGTISTADDEGRKHQSTKLYHNIMPTTTACTQQTWQQQTILAEHITTTIIQHRIGDKRGRFDAITSHEQTIKKVHCKDNHKDACRGMTHRK